MPKGVRPAPNRMHVLLSLVQVMAIDNEHAEPLGVLRSQPCVIEELHHRWLGFHSERSHPARDIDSLVGRDVLFQGVREGDELDAA